ncbi:uncharacterized protein LOC119722435 [Patiria miniata]|uniref:Uncharacterized protein n=1 Tax=Patiria miniata TaxID=46514 RepID=A0A913ZBR1_PATMI|nr:uncharacterized protein LOC119722435 [Patiria miniata]
MWAPESDLTTPDHGKTFQEILDTLTRPNKWIQDPLTVASPSLVTDNNLPGAGDATWTGAGGVIMNGSVTGHTTTGAVTHAGPVGITVTTSYPGTLSPVTSQDANTASDFWYRYGISITVAILVFAVVLVLVIQCRILYQKNFRRRRLVDLAGNRNNKAREDIFESFHRQETAQASMSSRLQSGTSTQQEDIPMRVIHETQPCHHQPPWRAPPAGRAAEPLARVYPLHHGAPARDLNANITDPFLCDSYRRLWNTTAGVYPIRIHRTVSSEPVIARPTTSRRYSSRSRVRRVRVRGDTRMPRFNLSGTRVPTSPESNGVHHGMQRRNRPARPNIRTTFAEANTMLTEVNTPTPKLVVPTNTPNTHCTDSAPENASPYGPGLDSDFGASAGIPHFTVSPDIDNGMNVTADTSVRDATYEWDTYDPAYVNRTVRYVDGAYFPVLQKRQYWV